MVIQNNPLLNSVRDNLMLLSGGGGGASLGLTNENNTNIAGLGLIDNDNQLNFDVNKITTDTLIGGGLLAGDKRKSVSKQDEHPIGVVDIISNTNTIMGI